MDMVRHADTEMSVMKEEVLILLTVPWKHEAWHTRQGPMGRRRDEQAEGGDKWAKALLCFLQVERGEAG